MRKYDQKYRVDATDEVLPTENAFRQDVDIRLDALETGQGAIDRAAAEARDRVIKYAEEQIAPRAAELQTLLDTAAAEVPTIQAGATASAAAAIRGAVDARGDTLAKLLALLDALGSDQDAFEAAMAAALAARAPLASPALTGAPTAPTAPAGTSTAQLATTAFVAAGLATRVRVDAAQGLTAAQQLMARGNIGAATAEDALAYLAANVPHLWHLGAAYALDGMRPSLSVDVPRSRAVLDGLPVDDSVLFTRSGATKVVVGPDGAPMTVPANTLAFDYSTGRRRLLLEGAATNLFIGSSAPVAAQNITVTAQPYTLSFWGTGAVALSVAASAMVTGTGANARTTYTFTPSAGNLTYTPSGSVTNVQIEAGARASSYIATTTVPATRVTDICQLSGVALAALSAAGPCTLAFRGACSQTGYAWIISLSGKELIRRSTDGLQVLAVVPLGQGTGLGIAAVGTTSFGLAIGWDPAGGIAATNGGAATTNAQAPAGAITSAYIGSASGVSGWIEVERMDVWPGKGGAAATAAQSTVYA